MTEVKEAATAASKLSAFVRLKMQEKGIPVVAIAHDAGTSHQYIYLVKDNLTTPSINNTEKILIGIGETWESFIEYMRAS